MTTLRTLASPLTSPAKAAEIRDGLLARLPALASLVRADGEPTTPLGADQAGVLLVLTGGVEAEGWAWVCDAMRAPVCLVAHPQANSLPAALELQARLLQVGRFAKLVLLRPDEDEPPELAEWLQGARVWEHLRCLNVGLVGAPSPWLVASSPDQAQVTAEWGPRVTPIPMTDLFALLDATDPAEHQDQAAEIASRSCRIAEPTAEEVVRAVQVHTALEQLVAQHGLDALTLRCFDLIQQRQTTGCLALALLSRRGLVAGCEGDLPALLTLLWARVMTGHMGFLANLQDVDLDSDTLWLAHCTLPMSEGWPFSLRSHFESGIGVALEGDVPPGPVTLLRIGGWDLRAVQIQEGEVKRGERSTDRCRTQARIRLAGSVRPLLESPLGNHLIMIPGHHREALVRYHRDFIVGR